MRERKIGGRSHLDQSGCRAVEFEVLKAFGTEIDMARLGCSRSDEFYGIVVERIDQQDKAFRFIPLIGSNHGNVLNHERMKACAICTKSDAPKGFKQRSSNVKRAAPPPAFGMWIVRPRCGSSIGIPRQTSKAQPGGINFSRAFASAGTCHTLTPPSFSNRKSVRASR